MNKSIAVTALAVVLLASACAKPPAPPEGAEGTSGRSEQVQTQAGSDAEAEANKASKVESTVEPEAKDGEAAKSETGKAEEKQAAAEQSQKKADEAEVASAKKGEAAQVDTKTEKEGTMSAQYRSLIPFDSNAPAITKFTLVRFETTAGNIDMEIYPEAAPNAAERFVELVKIGFYDDTPIFRVVTRPRPFVAQFGINWREGKKDWGKKCFDDDPSLFHLGAGTLAFAKAGPNTNSTQVFINYGDNDFLRTQNFSTFGKVVSGMEVAKAFRSVGDPDMGLDQGMLGSKGDAYLRSLPADQQPTMIKRAYVVK